MVWFRLVANFLVEQNDAECIDRRLDQASNRFHEPAAADLSLLFSQFQRHSLLAQIALALQAAAKSLTQAVNCERFSGFSSLTVLLLAVSRMQSQTILISLS